MDPAILRTAPVPVEEPDMDAAAQDPGGDWLDVCCWRCGSAEPRQDPLGRFLCPPCRAALSEDASTPAGDALGVVRGAYWSAHTLERCWRCLTASVDPRDEVGLCAACVRSLTDADASGREELTRR